MIFLSDTEYTKMDIKTKFVVSILFLYFLYNHYIAFDQTVLKNVDMEPFVDPVQINIESGQVFQKDLSEGKLYITPVATYKIYGRVIREHYRPKKLPGAAIYPYDVAIAYGPFKNKDAFKAMKARQVSTAVYWHYSYKDWDKYLAKYFKNDKNGIYYYVTNNHLCPANKNVKRGIARLKRKDVVYIEGYLIKYTMLKNNGNIEKGYSSTSRRDGLMGNNRNGNCEQIYVTRIVTRHGDYK